jgi:pimeloyl-ACP methyl ester carboxylesterase
LHPDRDLIIFDQRGVGLSEPALECPEFTTALLDLLDEPDVNAAIPAQYDSLMACRDRLISQGYDLSHYTTRQNAADVNAIRIALGFDQVNLLGGSYGSLLAQAVMRDFPENIRSVVMNSVLPLEKSLFTDASLTITTAIMHMLDSCAADPACSAAYPDLQNKLFEVVDRLNAEPVPITVTHPLDGQTYPAYLTGDGVVGNLGTFLYVSQIIPVLPQAIDDVYNGDYQLMTQLSSTKLSMLDLISRGMMLSVLCSDDLIGLTPEDWIEKRATLPGQLTGGADPQVVLEYGSFAICQNWPVEQGEPWVKEPLVSAIPTLLLEGEFDPVTPPEYGRLVDGYLSQSHFYEIPAAGHDVLANTCALSLARGFIQDPGQEPQAACVAEAPGVAFDIPGQGPTELVLEPFSDPQRGFSGLVPSGWSEQAPANLLRKKTALDPTYFVLEATPGTAEQLYGNLAAQLSLDAGLEPLETAEVGNFTWSFYSFSRGGKQVDLALAEDGVKAYFVFMVATPDEHETLYQDLFMPAVEAMASLE